MPLRCDRCGDTIQGEIFIFCHLTYSKLAAAKTYHIPCALKSKEESVIPTGWEFEAVYRNQKAAYQASEQGNPLEKSVESLVEEILTYRDRQDCPLAQTRAEAEAIAERFIRFWTLTLDVENFTFKSGAILSNLDAILETEQREQ